MTLSELREFTRPLPEPVRREVDDYAKWARESAHEIWANVEGNPVPNRNQLNDFAFLAGVQRLWAMVDAQVTALEKSFAHLERENLRGLRIGRTELTPTSPAFRELKRVRQDFSKLLTESELTWIKDTGSLTSLAAEIAERTR